MKSLPASALIAVLVLVLAACGTSSPTPDEAPIDAAPTEATPAATAEAVNTEAPSAEREDPENPDRLSISGAIELNDAAAYRTNIDTYPTTRSEAVFFVGYSDRPLDHFVDVRGLPVNLEVGTYAIEPNIDNLASVVSASLKIGIMPDDPTYRATEGEFVVDRLVDGIFSGSYNFVGEYEGETVTVTGTFNDVPLPS